MSNLDVNKFVRYLEDIMKENEKHIDNNNDADDHCKLENETLENVIHFIKNKKFYK